ncbi:dihydrodipicolinate synthase family protein [Lutispora saccharofermentans]|uniref:Dihydrodipicolinate synthase family protein n=1 Tax=Lutispora saccharofermentans TaxID=3024236 RepID=A0ABT1NBU0_9FIRM|nr:dihydrodipicolinate synthase family protein [Lutispora saccharofermentans]MCQ1528735.1 dihydrodipicolinate synthase family protein [Lutispora saccharofermentans]
MNKALFFTPAVTAFDSCGNIDVQANKNIYDHLINGGIDGIVLMGSTGEFFAMTEKQKLELIDLAVNHIEHRVKLYVGTGCMTVADTVKLSEYALNAGADGVMIISPYYFALTDESIEYFYDQVASQIKGDIFIYNYPDRTGHDVSPEITYRLLKKHKNITGYKDTVTDMTHTLKLISTVMEEFPNFKVFSGFEEYFALNVISGGAGCIGGLANLYPDMFSQWANAINTFDAEKISEIQKKVNKYSELYAIGKPFISIMKKAMELHGIEMDGYCIAPILQANGVQTEQIRNLMTQIENM